MIEKEFNYADSTVRKLTEILKPEKSTWSPKKRRKNFLLPQKNLKRRKSKRRKNKINPSQALHILAESIPLSTRL